MMTVVTVVTVVVGLHLALLGSRLAGVCRCWEASSLQ
jgi:hypothetical protein